MADLLREQDGLICRDQALVAGVHRIKIDGHVRHGRWQRVLPAVYLTEPSINGQKPTPSWRQRIRAAWMWAGDDAVISGLLQLPGPATSMICRPRLRSGFLSRRTVGSRPNP